MSNGQRYLITREKRSTITLLLHSYYWRSVKQCDSHTYIVRCIYFKWIWKEVVDIFQTFIDILWKHGMKKCWIGRYFLSKIMDVPFVVEREPGKLTSSSDSSVNNRSNRAAGTSDKCVSWIIYYFMAYAASLWFSICKFKRLRWDFGTRCQQ